MRQIKTFLLIKIKNVAYAIYKHERARALRFIYGANSPLLVTWSILVPHFRVQSQAALKKIVPFIPRGEFISPGSARFVPLWISAS